MSEAASDKPETNGSSEPSKGAGPFVWPPRLEPGGAALQNEAAAGATPGRVVARDVALSRRPWWRVVEDAWLDVRVPPLMERLARAGWAADGLSAFCWRCGASTGRYEVDDRGCAACREGESPAWDRFVRLGMYQEPLRSVVRDIKFTAWRRLGSDAGRMLGAQVRRAIDADLRSGALAHGAADRVLVVPTPTAWLHRMRRGIDHTSVLARAAARELDGRVVHALRRELRPSQTEVRASDRGANVAGSMHPRTRRIVAGLRGRRRGETSATQGETLWVVVDDIRTTGATLRVACSALGRAIRAARAGGDTGRAGKQADRVWAAVLGVAEQPSEGGSSALSG